MITTEQTKASRELVDKRRDFGIPQYVVARLMGVTQPVLGYYEASCDLGSAWTERWGERYERALNDAIELHGCPRSRMWCMINLRKESGISEEEISQAAGHSNGWCAAIEKTADTNGTNQLASIQKYADALEFILGSRK